MLHNDGEARNGDDSAVIVRAVNQPVNHGDRSMAYPRQTDSEYYPPTETRAHDWLTMRRMTRESNGEIGHSFRWEDQTVLDLIYFLLIGLAAGWLAGQFMKGRSFGLVGTLVVGVVGAILGGFLFRLVGLFPTGLLGSLIAATFGSVVLLFLLQKFGKRL